MLLVSASDGKVCLACLEDWVPSRFSIANILLSLQQLLSEPCFSGEAWNGTAVQVAKETPRQFDQIVLDTVMKSQRNNGGKNIFFLLFHFIRDSFFKFFFLSDFFCPNTHVFLSDVK